MLVVHCLFFQVDSEVVQTTDETFLVVGGCTSTTGTCTDDVFQYNGNGALTVVSSYSAGLARGAFGVTFVSYDRIVCE